MLKKIILCILISVCFTQEEDEEPDRTRWLFDKIEFANFQHKFNKSYSGREKEKRFEIFEQTLRDIEFHNKKYEKGLVTWQMGIGPFADLTEKEFMNKFKIDTRLIDGGKPPFCETLNRDITASVSHAQHLGEAKDQKDCNAGWAFAVVATAEAMLSKKNIKVSLSEQNILDCAYGFEYGSYGCEGGIPWSALNYMAFKGVAPSENYPFENMHSSCKKVCCDKYYAANICTVDTTMDNNLKSALVKGPLAMEIEVTPSLMHYRQGIIKDDRNCLRLTNHAVSLIGFGKGHWEFRNSWGPFWGEDGNYRLTSDKRYQCTFGKSAFALRVYKEENRSHRKSKW